MPQFFKKKDDLRCLNKRWTPTWAVRDFLLASTCIITLIENYHLFGFRSVLVVLTKRMKKTEKRRTTVDSCDGK